MPSFRKSLYDASWLSACGIVFSVSAFAVDRAPEEIKRTLDRARLALVSQDAEKAVALLIKLRNETSYFFKKPKDPLTVAYVRLYELAYTTKIGQTFLEGCAGGFESLNLRASAYSASAANGACVDPKAHIPAQADILKILEDARKIVSSPQNERFFEKTFLSSIEARQQIEANRHTDFLGKSPGPFVKQVSQQRERVNQRLETSRKAADDDVSRYSREAGDVFEAYVERRLGIDSDSRGKNRDALAEELHLKVMKGNRENCLANYLFYSQGFDFSDVPMADGDRLNSYAMESAIDLFGKPARVSVLSQGSRLVRTLPEKEEYDLAAYGEKALRSRKEARGGGPPFSVEQVYRALRPELEKLRSARSSVVEGDGTNRGLVRARLNALAKSLKNSAFGFLLDTDSFRDHLGEIPNIATEEAKAEFFKARIKEALKEQIARTREYAKWITANQDVRGFMGDERTSWNYAKSAAVLLYSSPAVIQGVIVRNPHLLGAICDPMKHVTNSMRMAPLPSYVMWGGGAMSVLKNVGSPVGLVFGMAVNGYVAASARSKIAANRQRAGFNQAGENALAVDYDQKGKDNQEIASANERLSVVEKQAALSLPVNIATGALIGTGGSILTRDLPRTGWQSKVVLATEDVTGAYLGTAATSYASGGELKADPADVALNFAFARAARFANHGGNVAKDMEGASLGSKLDPAVYKKLKGYIGTQDDIATFDKIMASLDGETAKKVTKNLESMSESDLSGFSDRFARGIGQNQYTAVQALADDFGAVYSVADAHIKGTLGKELFDSGQRARLADAVGEKGVQELIVFASKYEDFHIRRMSESLGKMSAKDFSRFATEAKDLGWYKHILLRSLFDKDMDIPAAVGAYRSQGKGTKPAGTAKGFWSDYESVTKRFINRDKGTYLDAKKNGADFIAFLEKLGFGFGSEEVKVPSGVELRAKYEDYLKKNVLSGPNAIASEDVIRPARIVKDKRGNYSWIDWGADVPSGMTAAEEIVPLKVVLEMAANNRWPIGENVGFNNPLLADSFSVFMHDLGHHFTYLHDPAYMKQLHRTSKTLLGMESAGKLPMHDPKVGRFFYTLEVGGWVPADRFKAISSAMDFPESKSGHYTVADVESHLAKLKGEDLVHYAGNLQALFEKNVDYFGGSLADVGQSPKKNIVPFNEEGFHENLQYFDYALKDAIRFKAKEGELRTAVARLQVAISESSKTKPENWLRASQTTKLDPNSDEYFFFCKSGLFKAGLLVMKLFCS